MKIDTEKIQELSKTKSKESLMKESTTSREPQQRATEDAWWERASTPLAYFLQELQVVPARRAEAGGPCGDDKATSFPGEGIREGGAQRTPSLGEGMEKAWGDRGNSPFRF